MWIFQRLQDEGNDIKNNINFGQGVCVCVLRYDENKENESRKHTEREKSVCVCMCEHICVCRFSISSSVIHCYVRLTLKHHPLLISAALSAGCPLSLPPAFIHSFSSTPRQPPTQRITY